MFEFVNYTLLLLCYFVLIWAFMWSTNDEQLGFVRIAIVFMMVFFVVPAHIFFLNGGIFYAGSFYSLDHYKFFNALFNFHLFLIGFFAIGQKIEQKMLKPAPYVVGKSFLQRSPSFISRKKVIVFAVFVLFILAVKIALYPNVTVLYEIRREEAELDPLLLFLSYFSNALLMSLLFILVGKRWRILALTLLIGLILMRLGSGSGRTGLLLLTSVAIVYLFRLPSNLVALLIPVVIFFGVPLLIIGKEIIYNLAVEGVLLLPDYESVISNNFTDKYFSNFGHPFISIYEVFGLIDLVGLRGFYDILHGFLFYGRVIGLDFGPSLTYYNTENLLGLNSSIIPTGYLAFGYVQAPFLGVVIMGLFFRVSFLILKTTALYKVATSEPFKFYISFTAANTFYTGEWRTMVIGFFMPALVLHLSGSFVQVRKPYRLRI